MKKKKDTSVDLTVDENIVSPVGEITINMSSNELPDPLADMIKSLRDKGLNDNRIASRLGITKSLVQSI